MYWIDPDGLQAVGALEWCAANPVSCGEALGGAASATAAACIAGAAALLYPSPLGDGSCGSDDPCGPIFKQSNTGPHGGARSPGDQSRIDEQRERRRKKREAKGRQGTGQKPSGEGFRDRENANRGPRGVRPGVQPGRRKRGDTTSPHTDGFNIPSGRR